jgi:hypothetical protein
MSDGARLPGRVRFVDSVRPRFGPDRGFLFDERSGRVFSLNGSGAFAAARLHERRPVAEVLAAMLETFDVDETTARRALTAFVEQLLREGVAEVLDG